MSSTTVKIKEPVSFRAHIYLITSLIIHKMLDVLYYYKMYC